jgi:5-oxoprolinase (ATP-hydrolysing) subunit A
MEPILLNLDAGELTDEPEEFYQHAHLVHIATGGHAGDASSMARSVTLARLHGTLLGAHPSYPDRENFGRSSMTLEASALHHSLTGQLAQFRDTAQTHDYPIVSVKAHGALYHDAARRPDVAAVLLAAVRSIFGDQVAVVGPETGTFRGQAEALGFAYWTEGFVDRRQAESGELLPRSHPNALITELSACVEQAERLARSSRYRTLCVHGDTPGALSIARAVRLALDSMRPAATS